MWSSETYKVNVIHSVLKALLTRSLLLKHKDRVTWAPNYVFEIETLIDTLFLLEMTS